MSLEFSSWKGFSARKKPVRIKQWLKRVGEASEKAFRDGMGNYPPASDPGAWPNRRTGRLAQSIRTTVTANNVTISTNTRYSRFLRDGTSKMARRKMSDDALAEGLKRTGALSKWAGWSRV